MAEPLVYAAFYFLKQHKTIIIMDICAISDMHGQLSFDIEACDVLSICGDIVPLDIQMADRKVFKWLRDVFLPWVDKQPCDMVLYVPGNHDWTMQRNPEKVKEILGESGVTMLIDEGVTVKDDDGRDIAFYGTPWCKQFYHWAFMDYTQEELPKVFEKIPNKLDILLTHDAPYGVSDILLQENDYGVDGQHIGNKALADAILEKKPKICLHGHLHSTNHNVEKLGDTDVYNVSLLDEGYKMAYKPFNFFI